eukprot:c24611_g1_i1 orf=1245-1547(+)
MLSPCLQLQHHEDSRLSISILDISLNNNSGKNSVAFHFQFSQRLLALEFQSHCIAIVFCCRSGIHFVFRQHSFGGPCVTLGNSFCSLIFKRSFLNMLMVQ